MKRLMMKTYTDPMTDAQREAFRGLWAQGVAKGKTAEWDVACTLCKAPEGASCRKGLAIGANPGARTRSHMERRRDYMQAMTDKARSTAN